MARMYPAKFPYPNDPMKAGERDTYNAFKQLPDDWVVFYSVRWQAVRSDRQADGEADFVLAHPQYGILECEVKGGKEIKIEDGTWYSLGGGEWHRIASPFEQAMASKYALREYLNTKVKKYSKGAPIGHFVVFPGHEQHGDLGMDAPRVIIWDKHDLKTPAESMQRVVDHWSPLKSLKGSMLDEVIAALAPTEHIKRFLRHTVEDVKEQLLDLTEEQFGLLRFLGSHRRARIIGGPGTGKTVLAAEKARELSAAGGRVLFTCYNAPLGEMLEREFKDDESVTVGSFHAICRRMANECALLPAKQLEQEWWDTTSAAVLPQAARLLDRQFDAVIVDEGQDFAPNWFDGLEATLADPANGFFYVFSDANQTLYRRDWVSPIESPPFELTVNCRNTNEIAARVNAVLGTEMPTLGTRGPAPAFLPAAGDEAIVDQVRFILNRLLNEDELSPGQVAVLSTEKPVVEALTGRELAGWELADGKNETVLCETVHRFKGLERDAVVLVLPRVATEEQRRLAYVGMSRAMVLLFVVGPESVRAAIDWPA